MCRNDPVPNNEMNTRFPVDTSAVRDWTNALTLKFNSIPQRIDFIAFCQRKSRLMLCLLQQPHYFSKLVSETPRRPKGPPVRYYPNKQYLKGPSIDHTANAPTACQLQTRIRMATLRRHQFPRNVWFQLILNLKFLYLPENSNLVTTLVSNDHTPPKCALVVGVFRTLGVGFTLQTPVEHWNFQKECRCAEPTSDQKMHFAEILSVSCPCAEVLFLQLPKLCTDLDRTLFHILISGKYTKCICKNMVLLLPAALLGVWFWLLECWPHDCRRQDHVWITTEQVVSFHTKKPIRCLAL